MKHLLFAVLIALFTSVVHAENLPDFTTLVESQEATVVNISTTTNPKPALRNGGPGIHGIPENDPMYEFFKRFGIPFPPNGGDDGGSLSESHSLGSGFILSQDGYVLTNTHVVQGADDVKVTLKDKREFKAKVVGMDQKTDVALLKIDATALPFVKTGDSNKVKVGEWVVAIGSPFGFESTVTKGIVSAKGRSLPQETLVPFIQTDVPINPGNSGGPLFNMKGEVIGINSQIYSRTGGFMGLSFAIPIDVAMQVVTQLRTTGKVSRGWLGVMIQEVTRELADSFGLSKPQGALVSAVEKGAPADKAGIRPSDIILRFDGKSINNPEDLPRIVSSTKPGNRVEVQVWRKGATVNLALVVGEMPVESTRKAENNGEKKAPKGVTFKLGVQVEELTSQQRSELEIAGGVLVTDVRGAAAKAGLQPGDVILSVNNTEIHSVDEFTRALTRHEARKPVALLVRRGGASQFLTVRPE